MEPHEIPPSSNRLAVVVWVYTLLATVAEALSTYELRSYGSTITDSIIFGLGITQVLTIAAYYMHLRHEPKALLVVALSPVMVVAALITGILFSILH